MVLLVLRLEYSGIDCDIDYARFLSCMGKDSNHTSHLNGNKSYENENIIMSLQQFGM